MPHHRRPLTDKKLSWRESKEQLRCVFCGRKLDLLDARDMISRKTQETYAYRCAEDCRRRQKWADQEESDPRRRRGSAVALGGVTALTTRDHLAAFGTGEA